MTALCAAWILVVAGGMGRMWAHAATPGDAARPPTTAPAGDALTVAGRPTVVAFFHPFCPCSRATVDALAALRQRHADASIAVVVEDVADDAVGPRDGEIWRRASAIAGVRLVLDAPDGAIARRFDAKTSGQVLAFAVDGTLAYAGGVTAARGHAGPCDGLQAVEDVLSRREPAVWSASVFGCELR